MATMTAKRRAAIKRWQAAGTAKRKASAGKIAAAAYKRAAVKVAGLEKAGYAPGLKSLTRLRRKAHIWETAGRMSKAGSAARKMAYKKALMLEKRNIAKYSKS